MKQIAFIFFISLLHFGIVSAQDSEYHDTMKEVVDNIQTSSFGTDLTPYANQMERIAEAEPKEWLPKYWASFCYLMKAYAEPVSEKKDIILEKAEALAADAAAISADNDEIQVLLANLASARMSVDPQNRWQKYGALSAAAIAKAKGLNAENPRIALHEAQGVFYTPEAYGGGKEKALPLIKAAIEKFDAFTPKSDIMPNWGKDAADYMLSEAEK